VLKAVTELLAIGEAGVRVALSRKTLRGFPKEYDPQPLNPDQMVAEMFADWSDRSDYLRAFVEWNRA
jgi:hypothetical protein